MSPFGRTQIATNHDALRSTTHAMSEPAKSPSAFVRPPLSLADFRSPPPLFDDRSRGQAELRARL
jgi:hypothetical protein